MNNKIEFIIPGKVQAKQRPRFNGKFAKRLILRAIENYRNKFILEEDLMSGEDKRKVLEEIDKEVEEIKHKESYKKEIKRLENRIHYICGLEDCNEEFEL